MTSADGVPGQPARKKKEKDAGELREYDQVGVRKQKATRTDATIFKFLHFRLLLWPVKGLLDPGNEEG